MVVSNHISVANLNICQLSRIVVLMEDFPCNRNSSLLVLRTRPGLHEFWKLSSLKTANGSNITRNGHWRAQSRCHIFQRKIILTLTHFVLNWSKYIVCISSHRRSSSKNWHQFCRKYIPQGASLQNRLCMVCAWLRNYTDLLSWNKIVIPALISMAA